MNRMVLGAVSALLLAGAGLFWWQGQASINAAAPPAQMTGEPESTGLPLEELPDEDGEGMQGATLPGMNEASREEKRFNRLDRNRDNAITRLEMLQPRIVMFRKLDTDHNNLLSFEEWSVTTSNKFKAADGDGNGSLNRGEYVTTKPKDAKKAKCGC